MINNIEWSVYNNIVNTIINLTYIATAYNYHDFRLFILYNTLYSLVLSTMYC